MAAVDDVSDPMVDDLTANLPDALLLHVLEYLVPSLADIGRCCRISSRFATIAADDQIWTAICTQCFGLTSVEAPDGSSRASYMDAARTWLAHRCDQPTNIIFLRLALGLCSPALH